MLAAFVLLKVGSIYDMLVFRPDFHGGWWEAVWVGSLFDIEGAKAFAGSSVGRLTYGGAGCFLLVSVTLLWIAFRQGDRKASDSDE